MNKRIYVATKQPNGKWIVDGIKSELTDAEFEKLKKLIDQENGGTTIWVI